MATSTVVPAVQSAAPATAAAKKPTWLSSVVTRVKDLFHKVAPVVEKATQFAEQEKPLIDVALAASGAGAVAPLFNTITDSAYAAELSAAAIGKQDGTGATKAALVLADQKVQDAFTTFESVAGVSKHSQDQQKAIIAAVAGALNLLNATPSAPTPSAS